MLFTSLAPNTEWDDALLALWLILRPWHWRERKSPRELEGILSRTVGPQYAISFESGRTALHMLLAAHGLAAEDEVVMQAYTCVAVPNAVLWAGGKPVFIDIDETLTMSPQDLEKKITQKTKAIIIQHTFGMPARMQELLAIARAHRLFIIEDCAHALGVSYNGKPLGSFGNAAFFSFGRDKVISGVFGGAVVLSDELLAERLRTLQQDLPLPKYRWILQQLMHPILMWLGKKIYNHGGRFLIGLAKHYNLTSKALEPEERRGGRPAFAGKQLPGALARLALHQHKKLERFTAHRIATVQSYTKELATIAGTQQATVNEPIPLIRFALWHEKAQNLAERAARESVFLGDWYDTVVAPKDVLLDAVKYRAGSCPLAEHIAARTINLPTDIHIAESDITNLTTRIRNGLTTH